MKNITEKSMNYLQGSKVEDLELPFLVVNKTTKESLYLFTSKKQKAVPINSSQALRLKNKANREYLDSLLDEHGCVEIEYSMSRTKTGIFIKKP